MADRTHSHGTLEGHVSPSRVFLTGFSHRGGGSGAPTSLLGASPPSYGRVKRQGGFTLLEVVVAFAILALSLGILIEIFSRALVTTALSRDYSRALTLAQARLADAGIDIPLEAGSYGGEPEDGFTWQVSIQPYTFGDPSWKPAFDAFLVTSSVSWGRGAEEPRRVSLSTLRLASSSSLLGTGAREKPEVKSSGRGE
jgi:general secretion pathway protein I